MTISEALTWAENNQRIMTMYRHQFTELALEQNGICIEALEKQIPKHPVQSNEPRYGMGNEYYDWICPTCGEWLAWQCDSERFNIHHCQCGQRIDFGRK